MTRVKSGPPWDIRGPQTPDPGGAGGYNHNTATTKTGEGSEAEEAKELAANKEKAATPTNLNSPISSDSARALAPASACKIPTDDPWPPDPGKVGTSMGHSFPQDPGVAGGYNHNAATTKIGEDSEAEGVKAVAKNKESSAPSTNWQHHEVL